jgi:hypothetical protein
MNPAKIEYVRALENTYVMKAELKKRKSRINYIDHGVQLMLNELIPVATNDLLTLDSVVAATIKDVEYDPRGILTGIIVGEMFNHIMEKGGMTKRDALKLITLYWSPHTVGVKRAADRILNGKVKPYLKYLARVKREESA